VIRENKKRMGPIVSNELILNTYHSTRIVNAIVTKKRGERVRERAMQKHRNNQTW